MELPLETDLELEVEMGVVGMVEMKATRAR